MISLENNTDLHICSKCGRYSVLIKPNEKGENICPDHYNFKDDFKAALKEIDQELIFVLYPPDMNNPQ